MEPKDFKENAQAAEDFDAVLKLQLEKRLNRTALPHEIVNADNDADLVNETLWQMVSSLYDRIEALEKAKKP